jgi:hypothetical protein
MTLNASSRVEFERDDDPRKFVAARPDRIRFLYIPYRRYLMIDGTEAPGGPAFKAAIGVLYPVAYTLHFALKRRGMDAPVGILEGAYWMGLSGPMSPETFLASDATRPMHWRLMLPVPEATEEEVQAATEQVARKKPSPALSGLRCEGWLEGECAQLLHIGPYDAEYPTVSRLHRAIMEAGLRPRGLHHEIYLSSPATPPERIKTIIRQPVEEAGW